MTSPGASTSEVASPTCVEAVDIKKLAVTHSNYVPAQMDRYIDFIDFSPNGDLTIGASCLTGRYWTGSLWRYREPALAPAPEKSLTGVDIDTGVVDGRVLGEKGDKVVIALDSGGIELVSLTSEVQDDKIMHYLERQASPLDQCHDDIITGLDIWGGGVDSAMAATVSQDSSLRVWSQNLTLVHNYRHAHSRPIVGVACHHDHPHLLATASLDLTVRVWDTRQTKPAVVVYRSSSTPPGLVSWQPGEEHSLLVAARTGDAWIQDIRAPYRNSSPALTPVMDRELRRAKWAPHNNKLVAVTGDDNRVKVLEVKGTDIQEKYCDSRHKDYPRGVAWNPVDNSLWSAGWDHQIFQHLLN